MLSAVLAQQIASETTEAIGHNVIITDAEAVVIGSGDETRVGTLHEASLEVMRTRESAWHTPEQARHLRGVRPGITLPLVLDDQAVGTVGITGSPRQVRRFGLLVRRQTEILLEESALLRNRLQRERAVEDLADGIAAFDPGVTDVDMLEAEAHELGTTLRMQRVAIVVESSQTTVGPEFLRAVRAVFKQPHDLAARRSTTTCLVLMQHSDSRSAADEARRLLGALEERLTPDVRIGLGEVGDTPESLSQACADAADSLALAPPATKVCDIRDLRTQQALVALSPRARQRLVRGTLADLPDRPDWPALRATVMAWCESGFNLVEAAAALNVHRNTLLYRLGKIERLLGRPWRDHRAMLTAYVACLSDLQHAKGASVQLSPEREAAPPGQRG